MSGQGTRLITVFAAAALLIGVFSACGGSDSGTSSSTSVTAGGSEGNAGKSGEANSEKGQEGGEGGQESPQSGGQQHRSVSVSPLHVSGGGSGQFRVKGGDNSIQDFGEESDEGELEEAARVLHDFYVARAEEDWQTACASLSKVVLRQLEQLASRTRSADKSCPATLAALTPPLPPAVQRETTAVDAGSLRVEGDRGFLIYRGTENAVYAINMALEGGWKVGALAGVPLS